MCHIGCLVSCSIICGFTSNIISAYHSPTHLEPNGMSPLLPLAIKSEFPIRWKKGREIVSCSKSRWHVRWMGVCPTHWHVAIPNERDSFCLNKILTRDRLSPSASESGLYVFCDFLQKPTIASATPFWSADRGKPNDETVVYTYWWLQTVIVVTIAEHLPAKSGESCHDLRSCRGNQSEGATATT